MKKILVSLAVLGFATSLFAQAAPQGTTISASVSGAMTFQQQERANDTVGNQYRYIDTRIRPMLTISNGSSKAVLEFEIDGQWGDPASPAPSDKSDATKGYVPLEGDRTVVEVRQAYYSTNLTALPALYIAAGLQRYDYPIWLSDTVPMAKIGYKDGPIDAAVFYSKYVAGNDNQDADNAVFYGIDIKYSVEKMATVRPLLLIFKTGDKADTPASAGTYGANNKNEGFGVKMRGHYAFVGGANIGANVDIISADLTFLYGKGKDTNPTTDVTTKYSGYAGYAKVSANVAPVKIGAFFNMATGTKDTKAVTTQNTFGVFSFDQLQGGNTFIMEDINKITMSKSNVDGNAVTRNGTLSAYGYWIYGIQMNATVGDLEAMIVLASGRLDEKPTGYKKDLGYEGDVEVKYLLAPGTKFVVEYGLHKQGDAYKKLGTRTPDYTRFILVGTQYAF